jgi:F0F1-type ATP synthase delta subunit
MNKIKPTADQIVDGILRYFKITDTVHLAPVVLQMLSARLNPASKVIVFTPLNLTEDQKKSAIAMINNLTKTKGLNYEFVKDSTLIDGMKIKIGDKLIDLSQKGRLNKIFKYI